MHRKVCPHYLRLQFSQNKNLQESVTNINARILGDSCVLSLSLIPEFGLQEFDLFFAKSREFHDVRKHDT